MQTFLPYPDFAQSARVLDRQRLGKQRLEVLDIFKALHQANRWSNHPAVKMWCNHEGALISYGLAICVEWRNRGYRDSILPRLIELKQQGHHESYPSWFGSIDFHASHRSNLLRKDPIWYGQFGWLEPSHLPYVWPTHIERRANA